MQAVYLSCPREKCAAWKTVTGPSTLQNNPYKTDIIIYYGMPHMLLFCSVHVELYT